ncbi:adenosylcobinamide-GDP ribazoletransferase [Corynebacterium sp.]|uniref:adenosylcobinamide-GDP ribazoletransferase n=1 Tax=Corynebacterium sp. TaxID=1720 RepID=UPI0026DA90C0|nr:adenosylcobinamide-GDP ribazoletransferase [Corynebacterium sp.]MDO5075970.1 adenosylcobinamide-GDP ribazoletransferase [Corynebacterium sp.]
MSGKAEIVSGEHGPALLEGPATALSWLTILPVGGVATAFDRTTGRRVMNSLPIVGLVLAVPTMLLILGLSAIGTPSMLVAVLCVAGWQWGTRMLHLDGLADVGDALGSLADPAAARLILADKYTGALGMGVSMLTLLTQVAALTAILERVPAPASAAAIGVILVVSRIAGMIPCHRKFHPLSAHGFGAMIIGTVSSRAIAAWAIPLAAAVAALGVSSPTGWLLALPALCALGAALAAGTGLARRLHSRFEGLNGDCVGATIELTAAGAAVMFVIAFQATHTLLL